MNKYEAEKLIQTLLSDQNATFRRGQWEAIDILVNQRRKLLVVQRTGWGKSAVYFIATRILRDQGLGTTIIISPLLALMRNQIQAAKRLGLHAETINSSNTTDRQSIQSQILKNQVDLLLISPERLANEDFVQTVLQPIARHVGLFVIDEAHCISDWGHDFRPDYRRLTNILKQMPPNISILATTATANDRVISDIRQQLGNIEVQRGILTRESLVLQTLSLPNQAVRLAWLARTIPTLKGTGIIYVLTVRDAEQVAEWLNQQNIIAKPYHGSVVHRGFENSNEYRLYLEDLLLTNKIKVLVATSALGMGYDKPDIGFVIHYQAPSSVIAYYQQVGRAGRNIERAYGILLAGSEDQDIHRYFRNTAFPSEEHVQRILSVLEQEDGLSLTQLQKRVNLRQGEIEKALKYLSVETISPVIKEERQWKRTPISYQLDHDKIQSLTQQREIEWKEIQTYIHTKTCLMEFLQRTLNDPHAQPCGCCMNCVGKPIIQPQLEPNHPLIIQAMQYLRRTETVLEPRKQMPTGLVLYGSLTKKLQKLQAQEGRILSSWGDAGWGSMIVEDKRNGRFRDELVGAVFEMIMRRWQPQPFPKWLTYVPSLRHPDLVSNFAERLAKKLQLPLYPVVHVVKEHPPQKLQQNSHYQCKNLDNIFEIIQPIQNTPVFLIDDVVDSRWTMTVVAALLRQAGSGDVFPVALASTTSQD